MHSFFSSLCIVFITVLCIVFHKFMHSFFSKNMGGVFVKILQIFWGAGRGGGELQRPPTRFNQQDSNLDSQDSSSD
jgi:hypothetical protein